MNSITKIEQNVVACTLDLLQAAADASLPLCLLECVAVIWLLRVMQFTSFPKTHRDCCAATSSVVSTCIVIADDAVHDMCHSYNHVISTPEVFLCCPDRLDAIALRLLRCSIVHADA